MRKRRVLAVLLALSLVVSGNGMTVLAAEQGAEQPVVMTQEETSGTSEEAEETEKPDTTDGSEGIETPGTTQEPVENDTSEPTENPGEQENPDAPKEDEAEEQPVEEEVTDPEAEQPVEDEAEEPAKEQEETDKAESGLQNYVSRIVTFTDDTGMKVTYDANASTLYHYVVENGVLKAVVTRTTVGGNTIDEPVNLEGNVELKQPEEGEKYTSIASSVFGGNQNITYVKLPAGVETITAEAFKGCTELKGVYLPTSVNKIETSAFENCTAMTQISVPKAVTSIGDKAFMGDAKLHLVHIKDRDYCNLTTIGKSAFEGCATLAEFCSDTGFVVPVNLQKIDESAFKGCTSIKKVDFSDTDLSSLGESAFNGCTGLTDLNMGDRISEIPQYAFAGCSGLMSLIIQDGEDMVIDSHAFYRCFNLKQLVLPQSVIEVQDNAFLECTNLGRVEVHNFTMKFGANNEAFPSRLASGAKRLFIVDRERSNKRSSGELYASTHSEVADWEYFDEGKDPNKLYGCVIEGEDPVKKDGKITGGKIWVQTADNKLFKELNGGKGVPSDNTRYYIYYEANNDFVFVSDSLRCNGEPVQKDDQKRYYFTMPIGGVIITAEFAPEKTDRIAGKSVTVEFSNGEPTDRGVSLKVGQTTRMFLIDENGVAIPSSKIQSIESRNPKVATVTKSGVITALGTNGSPEAEAEIVATVNGEDGETVPISRKIIVVDAEVDSIALKATKYPSQIVTIVQSAETGIQTASVQKNFVAKSGAEITLKANVYTAEQENISKELTWTTSNAKVAKVKTSKTDGKNPVNVVEIQKDCEGEATITVTATNPTDGANKKVTQKFVVQVYQRTYKLATTSLTVNPNAVTGGELEVIGSYGQDVSDASIQLYREEKDSKTKQPILIEDTNFVVRPKDSASVVSAKKFNIEANSRTTIVEKAYNLKVGINGNKETLFPLTITVKRSTPNPTVKFNTNKAKFNLFYKNGGTTAEGGQMSLLTEITKLGDVKVRRVALEPLSQKDDDRLFTENFVIDADATDLAKGEVVIKRSAAALRYTTQKRAAVTGNLVLYFDGYDDSAAKKVKVTMPTCTTAPSWALRTTTGTYRDGTGMQDVSLELYDKKSKTKEQVILDGSYQIEEENGDISFGDGGPKIADGVIAVKFWPNNEKMKLVLTNSDWERDQNGNERNLSYIYTVKVSNQKPTIKVDKSAVSLNLNYPEKAEEFVLVSSLGGVKIEPGQTFAAERTRANASEIDKLSVTYENGRGRVSIKPNETIRKGTYRFMCTPDAEGEEGLKTAVLTVKVIDSRPSVKWGKGTLQLNKVVYKNNSTANDTNSNPANDEESSSEDAGEQQAVIYRETSERTFKVSGKPEGYTLAPVGSGADKTEILCTTRNKVGAEQHFDFSVEEAPSAEKDDVLRVALKDASLTDGTYSFKMTPRYRKDSMTTVSAQPVTFQVKVINTNDITLTASAKGKINLVNREGEASDKNGIVYTPVLKNVIGEIEEVKIYDTSTLSTLEESRYFDICVIREGKDAGKFYVTPKKIAIGGQNPGDPITYDYVELENNKSYGVSIWVKVKGYAGKEGSMGGVLSKNIKIKTAQALPKAALNKTSMDVYLSAKNYDASFVVKAKEGSVGTVEQVYFAEKDEMANDSFTLIQTPQADGSMKVTVHLKEAVSFANGTNSNIKFYVKYKGQGTNTSETATAFTMKIRVN